MRLPCPQHARQHPSLQQGADILLQEEGVPCGAGEQQLFERFQTRVVPEECMEKLVSTGRRQWVQPQLGVVGLTAPAMLVLRPIIHQQQEPRAREALDHTIKPRLCSRCQSSASPHIPGAAAASGFRAALPA